MQKKLIALAVASAFAAPVAFAATSNVDIYGTVDLGVNYISPDNHDYEGMGNDGSLTLSSNVSRIGFKGSEDLGSGLSAIYQIETNLYVDGAKDSFGSLRNSFVGLHGGWGTFLMGKHDTPVKILGRSVDNFGNSLADSRNILGADASTGSPDFDLRAPNVIAYGTPNFSGVSALVAYVTSHTPLTKIPAASSCSSGIDCNKDDAYSGFVKYDSDMFMVGGGYEKHNIDSSDPLIGKWDRSIWRLVGSVTLGDFKLGAQYDNQDDNLSPHEFKRDGWGIFGNYKLGNATLKANYLDAGSIDGSSSTSAKQYTVGADYSLSKRTTVYAYYAKVDNSNNSGYGLGAGAGISKTSVGVSGADPSTFSVGLRHSF
jgi:predicted porin